MIKGGVTTYYTYGADGLRTEKQYGSTTYNYYYVDGQLVRMTWINSYIDFLYDESGSIYSIVHNGEQYYLVKNLQGDVVQLRSIWGTLLAEYDYDAWGNCTVVYQHPSYGDLANLNPIRYRGYFYDFETGFYYLQSRYYDPQLRRFISADDPGMLGASNTFFSYNLYGYCENNPVNYFDIIGYAKINIKWVGFAIDAMLIIIPALYAMSKSLKTISKSFSAINKIGEAIIKKGDKLFKKLDDWFYCLCAREKSYLILKSLGPIFSIVTVVTSIGEIVEYVIDILDGKWDGYLDTSNIKPKITFQRLY